MKEKNKHKERAIVISQKVFDGIKEHIGSHPAERGGMLGCEPDGVIRHFAADYNGRCTAGAYDPDIQYLNAVIKNWKNKEIEFCGFAHSHPPGYCQLSDYDKWYTGEIFASFKKLDILYLPIIQTTPDTGNFKIVPFIAIPDKTDRKKNQFITGTLSIEEDDTQEQKTSDPLCQEIRSVSKVEGLPSRKKALQESAQTMYFGNFDYLGRKFNTQSKFDSEIKKEEIEEALKSQANSQEKREKYISRICEGVNSNLLDRTRLVVIGTGGAASLIRNSARMGFGEFVLIDPDVVSNTNIATQQAEPSSIGLSKVEALGKDIVLLNPASAVLAIAKNVEEIDDQDFQNFFRRPLRGDLNGNNPKIGNPPTQTILMVLTDNFWAQARGHRLGLHFGLRTICAQEYLEGRGAEITYTVPGVTPACHRCITASRYRAYMNEDYKNDITSEGAPIFAAEMLNAVLGHVLLMVVHHGTDHSRWGNLIEQLENRNLLQLRMDPDFDSIFGKKFKQRLEGAKGIESFFMLDTIFLSQTPDCGQSPDRPVCPDCGGTGDLRDSIGKFQDTRKIIRQSEKVNSKEQKIVKLGPKQAIPADMQERRSK